MFEDPAPGFTFQTDESKLGQILRNLISNSLKFTQQGEVRVSAHFTPAGDAVVFKFIDTGIGIAPEDQERIFQELTQIENPIQKQVKGTGLGLPLSRRLAMLLGGTLAVQSALGAGSTFTLTLPVGSSFPADAVQTRKSEQNPGPKTVLVVDDDHASGTWRVAFSTDQSTTWSSRWG